MYLRRNIVETQREGMEGQEPETVYTYEEAQLTKNEALFILTEGQSSHAKAIEDTDAMNIDQEYRLTLLELGLSETDI